MTYLDYTPEMYAKAVAYKAANNCTAKAAFLALGWTEQELLDLKSAPRVGKVESAGKWPTINGTKTYPFSWLLTEEELVDYKTFHGSPSGTRAKVTMTGPSFSTEQKEVIESIRLLVDTLPAELQEKFAAAFPTEKEIKMRAIQAQMDALKAQMEELSK